MDKIKFTIVPIIAIGFVLLFLILPRLYLYTPTGDVGIFYNGDVDSKKSNDELLTTLYKLAAYRYSKVSWHFEMTTAFCFSLFILYIVDALTIKNFMITWLISFLAIDVPPRVTCSHQDGIIANQATQIYTLIKDRNLQNRV